MREKLRVKQVIAKKYLTDLKESSV